MYTNSVSTHRVDPSLEQDNAPRGSVYSPLIEAQLLKLYRDAFLLRDESPAAKSAHLLDLHQHLAAAEQVVMRVTPEKKVIALILGNTVETEHGRLYHLQGLLVSPEYQGKGVGQQLLNAQLRVNGANLLGTHTQSAILRRVIEKFALVDDSLIEPLADSLSSRNRAGNVDVGRYGGQLYGDIDALRSFAISGLDLVRGDARIIIGRVMKQ